MHIRSLVYKVRRTTWGPTFDPVPDFGGGRALNDDVNSICSKNNFDPDRTILRWIKSDFWNSLKPHDPYFEEKFSYIKSE